MRTGAAQDVGPPRREVHVTPSPAGGSRLALANGMSASTSLGRRYSIFLAGLLGPLAIACGGGGSDEAVDEKFPSPADDAYIAASPDTRSELGIEKWGVTNDGPANTAVVHGYSAKDEMLVELRHVTRVVDDEHVEVDITLSGKRGSAAMRIGFEGKDGPTDEESVVEMTMLANTFAENTSTASVLSHMRVDTNSDSPIFGSSAGVTVGGGSLVSSSITPQDGNLVGNCAQLLGQCGVQVVRAGGSAAYNSDACARLVRAEGISLICRFAGRFIGRLVGGAVGTAVAPGVGTAVGGVAGGVAGGALAGQACRYLTGATEARQQCVSAATGAAGQTARSSQECQSIRATCAGR